MNFNNINKERISFENLRCWSLYESHLINYPTVQKYLKFTFKNWVENLDQPLAIPWLRELLNNRLTFLEEKFFNLAQKTPKIIKGIIDELVKENCEAAADILIKVFSLNGELLSLNYLSGFFKKIEKINPYGDFKCNNDIIASVKTKSDMNFNLDIIRNYLAGLVYIRGNEDLTNFKIQFGKSNGINYNFRNSILKFLNNKLLDTLKALPDPLSEFDYNPKEFTFNDIIVKVDKYLSRKRIKVDFEFVNAENKKLKLNLTQIGKNPLRNKIRLLDIYRPDEEEYQLSPINNSLLKFINLFDDSLEKYKGGKFWGIINIPIPCRLQKAFLASKQNIESELKSLIGNREYKIVFYFYPVFLDEMKTEYIYVFN